MSNGNYISAGDINGDGYLNIMDVVQLINAILFNEFNDDLLQESFNEYPDFEVICGMDEFGNPTDNIGDGICGTCIGNIDTTDNSFPLANIGMSSPYPNPFFSTTIINLAIPYSTYVELYILDTYYNTIDILLENTMTPSSYSLNWDAENYADGYYRIIVDVGDVLCFYNMLKGNTP